MLYSFHDNILWFDFVRYISNWQKWIYYAAKQIEKEMKLEDCTMNDF